MLLTVGIIVVDSGQAFSAPDRGRGIEREQLPQQHYVSKAPTYAAEGTGSGPSEEEQCNEYQEAVNDEGLAPLLFGSKICAPSGAVLSALPDNFVVHFFQGSSVCQRMCSTSQNTSTA